MFATKGQTLGSPAVHQNETPVAGSNLRAFRQLFKADDESSTEPNNYPGFKRSDELVKSCQGIRNRICEEITLLELQIRKSKALRLNKNLPDYSENNIEASVNETPGPLSSSSNKNLSQKSPTILDLTEARGFEGTGEIVHKIKRPVGRPPKKRPAEVPAETKQPEAPEQLDQKFIGFSLESELHRTCKQRLEAINREILAEEAFIGFPPEDPLYRACLQKLEKIKQEVDQATAFEGFYEDDPLRIQCLEKYKSITSEISDIIGMMKSGQSVYKLPESGVPVKRTQEDLETTSSGIDTNHTSATHKVTVKSALQSIPKTNRLARVLHPNDKTNIDKMKHGPRVKAVRFRGGPGQALPIDKFLPDQYPWDQKYDDYGSSAHGFLQSPPVPTYESNAVVSAELEKFKEDILLGRQRCESTPAALIRAILPCSVQSVNSNGFAVVVTQSTPPRPLCFLCGSAGIDQLVFCSTCCEPFHPFCVGDTALALTFVKLKEEIYPAQANVETEKAGGQENVTELLSRWKCNRCWNCASCGGGRNFDMTKDQLEFFKCKNCRNTFHTSCAGKWYSSIFSGVNVEDSETVNWLCDNCVKCKSCGVKLENLGLEKKYARKKLFESSMLCLDCFKQIQKGSYCPVCNSSYDDDDYDTRMMECAKCERWVHARCEEVSEEQYQVLSHLPECVEFVCRLCDETDGQPLWMQAINLEISSGCEAAVRVFFKALVEENRKRRKLTFDDFEEVCESENFQLLSSPPAKKGKLNEHDPMNETFEHTSDLSCSDITPADGQKNAAGEVAIPSVVSTVTSENQADEYRRRSSRYLAKGGKNRTELFETSDGSLVNIQECKVYVRDVMKHPTREVSQLLSVSNDVFSGDATVKQESCVSSPKEVAADALHVTFTQARSPVPKTPASADVLKSLERSWMNRPLNTDMVNESPSEEKLSTPKKVASPLKKVGHFIEMLKLNSRLKSCFSVSKFFVVLSDALTDFFDDVDSPQRLKWLEEMKSALKEVFPWLNEELLKCDIKELCESNSSLQNLYKNILCVNPFKPVAWDDADQRDGRVCSFCSDSGDFRADDRGRLLWAGINEWIHVNCALWSSEIWEEESGALQQVSQALARSKNLPCKLCGRKGASVSCCQSHCKHSYHFHCAIKSGCAMKEDKSVFCKSHGIRKDRIQTEFHVQRRVFVDPEWIRKKEKPVESGAIKVFIGALRIDALGELNPRSIAPLSDNICGSNDSTCLVPSEFRCSRIYWSIDDPLRMQLYTISTAVDRSMNVHIHSQPQINDFNAVIDHSDESFRREKSAKVVEEFHNWLRNVPVYIDENDIEWIPPYAGKMSAIAPMAMKPVETLLKQTQFQIHKEANQAPVSTISFQHYMAVYLRLKNLRCLLDQQMPPEHGSKQNNKVGNAGNVRIPLSPIKQPNQLSLQTRSADNKAKLTSTILHEKARNNPEFCRKLFLCMVDGAVDSSSDSSSPSGSSVTGPSEEDSNENLESAANASSSDSEDFQRTSLRVTRSRLKETIPARRFNPSRNMKNGRQIPKRTQKKVMNGHECENCHSKFGSPAGLSRHKRSCGNNTATNSSSCPKPGASVMRRTRNSAKVPARSNERNESTSINTITGDPQVVQRNRESYSTKLTNESNITSTFDENVHEGSERNPVSEDPKNEKAMSTPQASVKEDPTTCETCGLTYRTHDSYLRHLEQCFPDSSSDASAVTGSESDDEPSDTVNSGSINEVLNSGDGLLYANPGLPYMQNNGLLGFATRNDESPIQTSVIQTETITAASANSLQSGDSVSSVSTSAKSAGVENGVLINVNDHIGGNAFRSYTNFTAMPQEYSQDHQESGIPNSRDNFDASLQAHEGAIDRSMCQNILMQQPIVSTSMYSMPINVPQQQSSAGFPGQCGSSLSTMMELTKSDGSNFTTFQGEWGNHSHAINQSVGQTSCYASNVPAYSMYQNSGLRALQQDCSTSGVSHGYCGMNFEQSAAGSTVYYTSPMNPAPTEMHLQDSVGRSSFANGPNSYGGYSISMGAIPNSMSEPVIIQRIEGSAGYNVRRLASSESPSFGVPLQMRNALPPAGSNVMLYAADSSANSVQHAMIDAAGQYSDPNIASLMRGNLAINHNASSFNSATPQDSPYMLHQNLGQGPCFTQSSNNVEAPSFVGNCQGSPLRLGHLLNPDPRIQLNHNHSCCDPMSTRQLSPVRTVRQQSDGTSIFTLPMEMPLNAVNINTVPQPSGSYDPANTNAAEPTTLESQIMPTVPQMPPSLDLPSGATYVNSEPVILERSDVETSNRRIAAGRLNHQSSNVAVVRPLENPLQRMSNQISQLELNLTRIPCQPLIPTSVSSVSDTKAILTTHGVNTNLATTHSLKPIAPQPVRERVEDIGTHNLGSVVHKRDDIKAIPMSGISNVNQDRSPLGTRNSCSSITRETGAESLPQAHPVDGFKLKLNLHHPEGSDHYLLKNITEPPSLSSGAMTGLKIRARVMGGEEKGTTTCVRVEPALETVSIKRENVSEHEVDVKSNGVTNSNQTGSQTATGASTRLVRRAVIVYEVKSRNETLFRSSNVQKVWGYIFEKVQGARENLNLAPLSYPTTSKLIRGNGAGRTECLQMLGVTHQAVQFLLEQLPGKNSVIDKHKFVFHEPNRDEAPLPINCTGCARSEPFTSRKPFDMFGWLASKHRVVPRLEESLSDWSQQDLPIAMRYRNLREKSTVSLGVYYSAIHGRGLFTRREIQEGEMIIEYAGELIRTVLSDLREKYYESKGIGCYFFTIDDKIIIDATMKGNAARFINHSCEPNCKSKAVEILGKKHILIFAERRIFAGEELTYDYKFALEDYDKKIPCSCGARRCRKYLN